MATQKQIDARWRNYNIGRCQMIIYHIRQLNMRSSEAQSIITAINIHRNWLLEINRLHKEFNRVQRKENSLKKRKLKQEPQCSNSQS